MEAEVEADVTLLEQGRLGYWFLVILEGSVEVRRNQQRLAVLGPGAHVGETAILGLGPQPSSVRTLERTRLLFLGRRELRGLCDTVRFRQNLLPDLLPDEFEAHVRRLKAQGDIDWKAVEPKPTPGGRPPGALPPTISVRRRRAFDLGGSVAVFLGERSTIQLPTVELLRKKLSLRAKLVLASSLVASCGAFSLTYHPQVVQLRPAPTIDALGEIEIDGAPMSPSAGHYLLVAVKANQPTLAGAMLAAIRGDRLQWGMSIGDSTARAVGREVFRDSQRCAIRIIEKRLGLDPGRVRVRMRDEDIAGPSAGLVFALALCDALDPRDLSGGRTIAATGEITDDGSVLPVGYVPLKAKAASSEHAMLFLVPPGERLSAHLGTVEVRSVNEAIRVISGDDSGCA